MQKVETLYAVMEELGITIECNGAGGLNIVDGNNGQIYKLKDSGSGKLEPQFPTGFEFKLTFEEDDDENQD
jgi:hypothetical protein